MRCTAALAVIVVSVTFTERTDASVIYDNGPLALGGANEIGVASGPSPQQSADDFVLTTASTITDVHWWGTDSLGIDDFTIQFFEDESGQPAEDPFAEFAIGDVVEVPASFAAPFDDVFEYAAIISPLTLDLGVTYWISIFNDSPTGLFWFWASAGLGNLHIRNAAFPGFEDWQPHSHADSNLGFLLTDDGLALPEPSTLLLLGAGLTAAALRRPRRFPKR